MDPRKDEVAFRCGEVVMNLLRSGITPRDILTHEAFENAIAGGGGDGRLDQCCAASAGDCARDGSAARHRRFSRVSERTPLLADLKPAGQYVAADVDAAGGMQLIAKRLLEGGTVNGTTITVTGKTFAEEAAAAKETPGQKVIRAVEQAAENDRRPGDFKGNLAPGGGVVKDQRARAD